MTAATHLARAYDDEASTSTKPGVVAESPHADVTESVTAHAIRADARFGEIAEHAEEKEPDRLPQPQPVRPAEIVDPDTVRVERTRDYEWTGTWIVLSGADDDKRLVGYLAPSGKKWQALDPNLVAVPGNSSRRSRKDALLLLLQPHAPRH